jgi:putative transcriptional regulator
MNPSKPQKHGYQSRTLKNVLQLAIWGGVWLGTCGLMALGPRFLWNKILMFTLLAVGLNFCVGVGLILAHKKYLASLDELQRKVYLDALGITVGVVLIVAIPYAVLDNDSHVYDVSGIFLLRHVAIPMKNRLKVLRAERNWTQAQLADALDVSRQTINAIETGKFDPSLPLAFRAARLFGLAIEAIFHDEDRSGHATKIEQDPHG